jgi:hypothetical protein
MLNDSARHYGVKKKGACAPLDFSHRVVTILFRSYISSEVP